MLIVVDFSDEARGYRVDDLRRVGVANDVVAGVEIAVVIDPDDPNRWVVLSRRLGDGTVVELEFVGGELRDRATGTRFDITSGRALDDDGGLADGGSADSILGRLSALTSFPGDFDTFWPDAEVWQP